jgi:cell division protein FtsW
VRGEALARPVRHPGDLRWETRLLAVVTATLVAFGIAATYSAASLITRNGQASGVNFAINQTIGALLGGVGLIAASRIDYYRWRQFAWPLLGITIACLMVPLLPFAHRISPLVHGARRWIDIGPLNFQPSEIARVTLVIWCAMIATKKGQQLRELKKGLLPCVIGLGTVFLLIAAEPNLSMAVLVALLAATVLFTAGAKIGHFMLLGLVAVLVVWHKITHTGFRSERLGVFLNGGSASDAAWQINQSLIGFGSGRLIGVGFGHGQQKMYLPFAYSDFLFSTIGEEWGFVGVCLVVLLFALFIWLGFRIAKTAADPFGQYLAVGLTCAIGLTAFMHMAVTIKLMPTTGLTLPFMSYGRSSLVISMVGTGILINIGRLRGKPRSAEERRASGAMPRASGAERRVSDRRSSRGERRGTELPGGFGE